MDYAHSCVFFYAVFAELEFGFVEFILLLIWVSFENSFFVDWNFVQRFRDIMSLLYSTNFKFSNDEMKKYPDFMDCDSTNNHHSQQEHNNSGGLMRYCSAPTSLFASLVDGTEGFNSSNNGGGTREDYRFIRSSSPEVEVILSRFMASCNGKFDSGSGERTVKEETGEPVQQQNGFCNQPSSMVNTRSVDAGGRAPVGNSYGVMNSSDFDNSMQSQLGARNCSNLFRQSSSPAGFFSHLIAENGNISVHEIPFLFLVFLFSQIIRV